MHSTEHRASAAQQGSTAGCSKEGTARVLFPSCGSAVTQHMRGERKGGPSAAE